MRKIRGKEYLTIADAAEKLGISISTLHRYIRNADLPPPKREFFGKQAVAIFSPEYIIDAKKKIEAMRRKTS